MTLRSCILLHNNLVDSILRAPLQFFESTPCGRIMNRMSKDLEAFHKSLPSALRELILCLTTILSLDIIISYSTPLFLLTLVPIFLLYFFIQVSDLPEKI